MKHTQKNITSSNSNNDDMGRRFEPATPEQLAQEAVDDLRAGRPVFNCFGGRFRWDGSNQDVFLLRLLGGHVVGPFSIEEVYDDEVGEWVYRLIRLENWSTSRSELTGETSVMLSGDVAELIRVGDYRSDKGSVVTRAEGRFRPISLPDIRGEGGEVFYGWHCMVPVETHEGVDNLAPAVLSGMSYDNNEMVVFLGVGQLTNIVEEPSILQDIIDRGRTKTLDIWNRAGGKIRMVIPGGYRQWGRRPAIWSVSRLLRDTWYEAGRGKEESVKDESAVLDAVGVKRVRHESWGRPEEIIWGRNTPVGVNVRKLADSLDGGAEPVQVGEEITLWPVNHYLGEAVFWTWFETRTAFDVIGVRVVLGNNRRAVVVDTQDRAKIQEALADAFDKWLHPQEEEPKRFLNDFHRALSEEG